MIDTHCHLDAHRFDEDRDQVIARAFAAGVEAIVVPGVVPAGWVPLRAMAEREPRLLVGFGIHPQALPELPEAEDDAALERLDAMLAGGGAVAVGECGLDGPSASGAPIERQARVLKGHLALARKHGLPLLLHCHKAHPAMLQLLREEALPAAGAVMHSYSGGPELLRDYGKLGLYFSFAGPVTWPEARKPVAAAREVPLERLLVETDAPDQSPSPHRGQRSEPAYLARVVEALARIRGVTPEELAARTGANARRLFSARGEWLASTGPALPE